MPETLDPLGEGALRLPREERLLLALRLLESVDLEPEPGAEEAWDEEITRRIARFDAGETETIPASEVFARLREIAPGE
jgi:putative addiction module component (TIGR02574 family)